MINQFFPSRTGDRPRMSRIVALACAATCTALFPIAVSAQQPAPPAAIAPAPAATAPATAADQTVANQAGSQAAVAQPAATASGDTQTDVNTPTIKLGVNEVNLIFTVTDNHGHYIPNLKQSDFALLDNQRAPAEVTSFHQQINLPLRVGIVIDASTSIHERFQFEQQAATDFLLQVLKAKNDRAFVMGFDVTPDVTADWTNDYDKLEGGINSLHPGGGTALFDAVYTACRDKLLTTRGQEPFRKAIILISDGDDNQSHVYESEAIKECERAETIVYAISTNWTPSRGRGDKILTELAEDTGGEVFFPPSVEDMSTSFTDIAAELRSQYALTYTPADFTADGAFRTIYLYCYDRRYKVRARKGYFAPRP
jgi:Ca-activated chloride channel homolog